MRKGHILWRKIKQEGNEEFGTPNSGHMLLSREVTQWYRMPRSGVSELLHKGCPDIGHRDFQVDNPSEARLQLWPVRSLGASNSFTLRPPGPLLCQRSDFPPCVSTTSLVLDGLRHWAPFFLIGGSTQATDFLTLIYKIATMILA